MNDLPLSENATEILRQIMSMVPSAASISEIEAAAGAGLALSSDQIEILLHRISNPLAKYLDHLFIENGRFGLVSKEDARDRDRLFLRHIVDSLIPWRIVNDIARMSRRCRLYDLGSGAGLPGIPLSIVLSNLENDFVFSSAIAETVLVERKAKRVAFLRGVIPATLSSVPTRNRPALRVVEVDADDLRTVETGKEDEAVVVFRAYQQTSLDLLRSLAMTFPHRTPVCALKGRRSLAEEEREFIERSGYALVEDDENEGFFRPVIIPYPAAFDVPERCLLIWWTRSIEGVGVSG